MTRPTLTAGAIEDRFEEVLASGALAWPLDDAPAHPGAIVLGRSREGRPVHGYRFGGSGPRVSIIGGCHADEPVGPRLLGHLVPYLAALDPADPLVTGLEWWVIPHINPDGAALNACWQHRGADSYSFSEYLPGRVRELPGEDIEFGFPRTPDDDEGRPEPAAAAHWWAGAGGPFDLHLTLHGMAWAGGPWFLIEPAWVERTAELRARCARRVSELGYRLHDVERHGEKGFTRIEPGFATRPDSAAMRDHFLALDDPETAGRFRPSSMEYIRSLGGDPLTLVSEMPLFTLARVGARLGPPDPELERWRDRIAGWTARSPDLASDTESEAAAAGLAAMPVVDQMRLQWALIAAAIATVNSATADGSRTPAP
ncbi:MAG: M14 family zinc carboxypeptidase [Gemmatimonadota bacterium]